MSCHVTILWGLYRFFNKIIITYIVLLSSSSYVDMCIPAYLGSLYRNVAKCMLDVIRSTRQNVIILVLQIFAWNSGICILWRYERTDGERVPLPSPPHRPKCMCCCLHPSTLSLRIRWVVAGYWMSPGGEMFWRKMLVRSMFGIGT